MFKFFEPNKIFSITSRAPKYVLILFVIVLSIGLIESLILSPEDYKQGHSVRIMYVHVPAAWITLGIFSTITLLSIFGYIFKYDSVNYYYNAVMDNGMYEINKILNVKYNVNSKHIVIELEHGNLYINRETLVHSVNNNITARCKLSKSQKFFFNLLNERKKKLNNEIN